MTVREALLAGADAVVAAAVLVAVVGVARALPALARRDPGPFVAALALALELLLAAGLLRLGARPDAETVALALFVVLLRKTLSLGLRFGARAIRPAR